MGKSVVAVLKTSPERVLEDIPRLMEMAGAKDALPAYLSASLAQRNPVTKQKFLLLGWSEVRTATRQLSL